MKKTIFIALLAIFSLNAAPVFAAKTSANAIAEATTKLTEEEVSNYRARVEEIREMDKSELSSTEKKELKSELKDIKETMRKDGSYIYIGGSTLLVIIIILLII